MISHLRSTTSPRQSRSVLDQLDDDRYISRVPLTRSDRFVTRTGDLVLAVLVGGASGYQPTTFHGPRYAPDNEVPISYRDCITRD